jgi:hypothetical protein
MMIRVLTGYVKTINSPKKCVNCGKPAGAGKKQISASNNYATRGTQSSSRISFEFPLCDSCTAIQSTYAKKFNPLGIFQGKDKDDWATFKNIEQSVSLANVQPPSLFNKNGNLIFRFYNEEFGREFSMLNEGTVSEKASGKIK